MKTGFTEKNQKVNLNLVLGKLFVPAEVEGRRRKKKRDEQRGKGVSGSKGAKKTEGGGREVERSQQIIRKKREIERKGGQPGRHDSAANRR